ncbi:MAG: hypothetical protein ACK4NW_04285 [Roseinatronobacter sp.]
MRGLLALVTLLCLPLSAFAEAPLSPRDAGTAPWLGMNMTELRDYQPQRPFIDVMKSARAWYGHLPGQWGGWEEADLIAAGAIGEHGWPVKVPSEITGISTMLLMDLAPDTGGVAGNYRLTHDGDGRIEIGGRTGGVRRRGLREIWFSFTPGDGGIELTIRETSATNPIRNIEIVHQDHIAAHERGDLINPDWRARMEGMALLRFMGWQNTNYATWRHWQDRPLPDDYSWTPRGVPVEILIRVANDMNMDPWFNIPHLADDEYIEAMAELIRDQLDPHLTAWIEFSNETWNWSFPQAAAAADAAQARWGNRDLWQEWNAMRAAQMVQIFNRVFEGEEYRLKRVLATQTGWIGLEDQLEARHWQAESPDNPAPPSLFDVYAITGYFSGIVGEPEAAPRTRAWLEQARSEARAKGQAQGLTGSALEEFTRDESYRLLEPKLTEDLLDGRHSGVTRGTVTRMIEHYLPYHLGIAERWGLELVAYEGGTHLLGLGEVMHDPDLTDLFVWFNYTEGMGQLYTAFLEGWHASGGGLFVHYSDIRRASRWGSFGALRHVTDENPRWTALVGFDPEKVRP